MAFPAVISEVPFFWEVNMKNSRMIFTILGSLFFLSAWSAPREIVIIRHGDKLLQKPTGIFLSAKGQVRAEKFLFYFIKHFKQTHFIFTTNPVFLGKGDSSFRPTQTIAPLANYLTEQGVSVTVNSLFHKEDYSKLARFLLKNPHYTGRFVLICWEHHRIAPMVKALGVKGSVPVWQNDDFDSVYILKYQKNGTLKSFQILRNQYPVKAQVTWSELLRS